MRSVTLFLLAWFVTPSTAYGSAGSASQAAETAPPESSSAIVITGINIQGYRDRLAQCLARDCPPDEDIAASSALAEALFLGGDYVDSYRVLNASLQRNRREAGAYPEPVSTLYRAHARIARHVGRDANALRSTYGILNALREGIPREDHRHFTARLEISEAQMAMSRYNEARRELEILIRHARAAGREDVAILAELRLLWFGYIADPRGPALAELITLSRQTDPSQRMRIFGAKILLARIYRLEGNVERADALLADVGRGNSTRRRLISSPDYQLVQQEIRLDGEVSLADAVGTGNTLNRVAQNYEGKWIDVGFWVMPDGSVSSLEILRQGASAEWATPLLESIRGRLYSTADEQTYRLERYTLSAGYEDVTGTRIQRRSPRARVEYFDLTDADIPAPTQTTPG